MQLCMRLPQHGRLPQAKSLDSSHCLICCAQSSMHCCNSAVMQVHTSVFCVACVATVLHVLSALPQLLCPVQYLLLLFSWYTHGDVHMALALFVLLLYNVLLSHFPPALPSPVFSAAPPLECRCAQTVHPAGHCTRAFHLAMCAAAHPATWQQQHRQYMQGRRQ
jgi:hypothetical protein